MPQGRLPYKYEEEKKESGLTAMAGLPVWLDLASVIGLSDHIRTHMHVRPTQGWTDEQVLLSLSYFSTSPGETMWMTCGFLRGTRDSPESCGE